MKFAPLAAALVATAAAPLAAAPRVVADIPPVHSLVARVMDGVAEPALIVRPGASPHGYAMKPSEAHALSEADLVFWVGEALTPWLEAPIDDLGAGAKAVELMAVEGVRLLEMREGARFEAHDHGEDGHDDHGHDDHGEEEAGHDDHGHDDHGHDDHGHGDHHGVDPHVWLDPENAKAMLFAIAAELGAKDAENSAAYAANAAAGAAEIDALMVEVAATLDPVRGKPFVVFHDAYHYFEARFDFEAAGAISLSDASTPGPARVQEIHDMIGELNVVCVFHEPQMRAALAETVTEGSDARAGVLDPLGASLEPGAGLYPGLMRGLAGGLASCLGG